jgi:hypothetical protein
MPLLKPSRPWDPVSRHSKLGSRSAIPTISQGKKPL